MPIRRLHHLAREIRVDSKSIIDRCRAAGHDVRNHMHVLTPELERDIRDWFPPEPPSDGEDDDAAGPLVH